MGATSTLIILFVKMLKISKSKITKDFFGDFLLKFKNNFFSTWKNLNKQINKSSTN
jgi:hypothetical protein